MEGHLKNVHSPFKVKILAGEEAGNELELGRRGADVRDEPEGHQED